MSGVWSTANTASPHLPSWSSSPAAIRSWKFELKFHERSRTGMRGLHCARVGLRYWLRYWLLLAHAGCPTLSPPMLAPHSGWSVVACSGGKAANQPTNLNAARTLPTAHGLHPSTQASPAAASLDCHLDAHQSRAQSFVGQPAWMPKVGSSRARLQPEPVCLCAVCGMGGLALTGSGTAEATSPHLSPSAHGQTLA